MTETLKTINEIALPFDGCACKELITEEIIKWVKHHQEFISKFPSGDVHIAFVKGKIAAYHEFFNLSEEDLI